MKKRKILFRVTTLLIILLLLTGNGAIFAIDSANLFRNLEYSEEYKRWLELPKEEREKVVQPRIYDIEYENRINNNPIFELRKANASNTAKYNLKEVIPDNLIIRNQKQTNECWAFASISSLETNLALANNKDGKNTSKIYDYSERHMDYSTSKTFLNNETNKDGYNREVGSGGNWAMAETYLINGMGAIDEKLMPFENNENKIEISKIKDKKVTSQVYDTIQFPDYQKAGSNASEIKNQIKQHIQNYGAVYASIHGNSLDDSLFPCYNNESGAKFCNNPLVHAADHAISIIGWDDNYSIDKFSNKAQPTAPGAWIIRNSWGEKQEYTYSEFKEELFKAQEEECIQIGWNSASDIPDEVIIEIAEQNGFTVSEGKISKKIGDNGLMYVSYEDCNISKGMCGIVKAKDYINYENIYQYDEFYPIGAITASTKNVLICNVFDKKTNGKEYLNQISLHTLQKNTCKVYVNPNGDSKSKTDLQKVKLKTGEAETIEAGYHTIEFDEPIEIKGGKFAVVVELESSSNSSYISLENNTENLELFNSVKLENNKCFVAIGNDLENCEWVDLGNISKKYSVCDDGDSTIKAFTSSKIIDESVKSLEIVTPPTKVKYLEGENFDRTGMVVKVYYNNDTSEILDEASYNISNGTALKAGQTSVTISYDNKNVEQPITVEKNNATELKIKTPPTKTNYKEGEDFNKTGMVVEAKFKDGNTRAITDYKIENGNALKLNQTSVIISYDSLTVTQPIKVEANPLIGISVTKEPTKTKYIVGQDFDKTGMVITANYESGLKKNIEDYTIENGQKLKKSQESVTIKYQEKVTTQKIIVEDKAVTQITIDKKPTKLSYIKEKEKLDLTGGTIKATYNDGTTEIVEMKSENVKIDGFSNKTVGKVTITVTYQNKNTAFDVEIIEPEVKEDDKIKNTDFKDVQCRLLEASGKIDPKTNKEYCDSLVVEIYNIKRESKYKDVEYYYHISSEVNEKNINTWTKVNEEQKSDDKLKFSVDLKNLPNINAISNDGKLYLYVKEVVKDGGNQSVVITKGMELQIYEEIEGEEEKSNTAEAKEIKEVKLDSKDTTTANNILPKTGIKKFLIIISLCVGTFGVFGYIRYKKLGKYIK